MKDFKKIGKKLKSLEILIMNLEAHESVLVLDTKCIFEIEKLPELIRSQNKYINALFDKLQQL